MQKGEIIWTRIGQVITLWNDIFLLTNLLYYLLIYSDVRLYLIWKLTYNVSAILFFGFL